MKKLMNIALALGIVIGLTTVSFAQEKSAKSTMKSTKKSTKKAKTTAKM
jgi:hypothetical protein